MKFLWLRLLLSAAAACAFVIVVVGIGIRVYNKPKEYQAITPLQEVRVVNLRENPELAEIIRKKRAGQQTEPEPRTPPPPVIPEREITGFVQLEYTINPDGTASDVKVLGAAPAGVYEEQAVARTQRSMHAPAYENGEPVARRVTEIVEFTVPASEVVQKRGE